MAESIRETSPHVKARIAGIFYLLTFVTGALAAIFSSHGLAQYAGAANLIATLCYLVVTLLFYDLFKPVNSNLSIVAALFC